jgi:flagellar operon protein
MDQRFRIGNPYLPHPMHVQRPNQQKTSNSTTPFRDILNAEIIRNPSALTLSNHADKRLKSRGIELNHELMKRLEDAVEKARLKGSKDALVVLDNLAFVVSVKNRTVITAMDGDSLKENVFTNIDSAVFN